MLGVLLRVKQQKLKSTDGVFGSLCELLGPRGKVKLFDKFCSVCCFTFQGWNLLVTEADEIGCDVVGFVGSNTRAMISGFLYPLLEPGLMETISRVLEVGEAFEQLRHPFGLEVVLVCGVAFDAVGSREEVSSGAGFVFFA